MIEHWELLHRFDYSPETGEFKFRVRAGMKGLVGKVAGYLDPVGYIQIRIDGKNYLAHRLAWFYVHGVCPVGEIDHRDGDKSNNRIANLEDTTTNCNQQNRKRGNIGSKSGLLGVSWHEPSGTWRSSITTNGKWRQIGTHATSAAAHEAYLREKAKEHYAPQCFSL